jgi:hypothetical protein
MRQRECVIEQSARTLLFSRDRVPQLGFSILSIVYKPLTPPSKGSQSCFLIPGVIRQQTVQDGGRLPPPI